MPDPIKTSFPNLQKHSGLKESEMEVTPTGEQNPQVVPAAATTATLEKNGQAEPAPNAQASVATDGEDKSRADKPKFNSDELSDEEKDELLAKLTGGKIKSRAELEPKVEKTAEEIAKEKEDKKKEALAWGIDSGKIKMDEYDKAVLAKSKSDREIALQLFTAEEMAEDKDLKPEEAEQMLMDAYHEGDEESKLFKVGQKEIKKLADAYRKETAAAVDGIDQEYEQHTQIISQFKAYKGQVKKVAAELPKEVTFNFDYEPLNKELDGAKSTLKFSVPVDEKAINKIISDYSSENNFALRNTLSNGKIDEKKISEEMSYHLKAMMFDKAIPELLKQNAEQVEKLLLVQLGNKRNPTQSLNNGQQPVARAPQKQNTYANLNAAIRN